MTREDYKAVLSLKSSRSDMPVVSHHLACTVLNGETYIFPNPAQHTGGDRIDSINVRHLIWEVDVINTRTQEIVVADNLFGGLDTVVAEAHQIVEEVRNAWTRGYLKKRFQ